MTEDTVLYHKVVAITSDVMGSAAEQFVNRQIENHLHKQPERLSAADLEKLVDWMKLALTMLIDNKEVIETYGSRLLRLTESYKEGP